MTLVFSGLGSLVQSQFGVNEIASTIAVGKQIGSLFTRQSDALIFEAFTEQYGVRFTTLPPWLEGVKFVRSGTILGDRQRQISCQNTFPGVEMSSVEGAATFLLLVTRYVESSRDLVKYVEDLILGKYKIVSGGDLEHPSDEDTRPPAIPYASRKLIHSFVSSVIDSDALSPQRELCLQYMSELAHVVGSSVAFQQSANRSSRGQYERLLRQLLGQQTTIEGQSKTVFNTLSTGAAMIGLAALANGADVRVVCQTSTGTAEVPQRRSSRHESSVFTLILWLREPPSAIAEDMGFLGGMDDMQDKGDEADMVTVYGGAVEISRYVASQTGADMAHDLLLAVWELRIEAGEAASWEMCRPNQPSFRLTDEALACAVPAQIAKCADAIYSLGDRRRKLVRKAASILHEVLDYTSYERLGKTWFKIAVQQVYISYAVGCLRYCWTSNCSLDSDGTPNVLTLGSKSIIAFALDMVDPGVTLQDFLWLIASVWGGSNPRYHNYAMVHDRVVGITAPHLTILANVLQNPKDLAEYGLSKGFISIHAGSIPMLPRDSLTGMVVAADPSEPVETHIIFSRGSRAQPDETDAGVLFYTEPYHGPDGTLCALLCAWQYGEVLLELDPVKVFDNLLLKRGLRGRRTDKKAKNGKLPGFLPLRRSELGILKYFLLQSQVGIIRAEGRPDWQVVAAGAAEGGNVIMACEDESLEDIIEESVDLLAGFSSHLIIVCKHGFLPKGYLDLLEPLASIVATQGDRTGHFIDYKLRKGTARDEDPEQADSRWTIERR
ncbi:hypothetical protein EDB81DRAFT_947670 [Dactylonectria macrodidyma]|uniref:Uncharacterized protein n=1 Tax=Dactylonectria macrodidyma TaxID=307937 RepID=A0A9P9J5M6_9HYPO|nr:hypothetical protein EDB81DRAFT_947670 [Dactylonectria macrodidyma]